MKNAFLSITRQDHDVEVEVAPDNPAVGYVTEDTPEYDENGDRAGMLYLADETIPLTLLEEEEARERLEETNRSRDDDDPCDDCEILTKRQQDAAADDYFQNRFRR